MKKCLLLLMFITSFSALKAAPGDTTWVQAHSGLQMDWFNDFDTTVKFPDANGTTYRKVYMIFTLGKYVCPAGSQWCGDWDYTVQTFFMSKNTSDTVELGRFMTPYAHTNSYRFSNTWTQRYIFDVSDYYNILRDSGTVRIHYSGYSGGFTANVRFAFVEGTPERNVLKVDRLWHGDFNYGHGSVPINDALGTLSRTVPAGTQSTEVKMNITGHGGDDLSCAEFCPNTYTLSLNGNLVAQQNFFRDDCAANELYAQTGTWIYARANWCPGALVNTITHALPNVSSNYTLGMSFPAYTSTTNQANTFPASYTIDAAAVYYGSMNHALDASLEDIIAPTDAEYHFRENPNAISPIVRVKNSGSAAINSIKFEYSVSGGNTETYTWTAGNLASLQSTDISFPYTGMLRLATGTYEFHVKILEVNGQSDDENLNNELASSFKAAPMLPADLIVRLKTNDEAFYLNTSRSETSWRIEDAAGNIVNQNVNCPVNTTCVDTVHLNMGTSYRLIVVDSSIGGYHSIDQNATVGVWHGSGLSGFSSTSGSVTLLRTTSVFPISLPGYYGGNFGNGMMMDFYTGWTLDVPSISQSAGNAAIEALPNPAKQSVVVNLTGMSAADGIIRVVDAMGKVVLEQPCRKLLEQLNVSALSNGLYTIIYSDKNGKLQTRLLIAK